MRIFQICSKAYIDTLARSTLLVTLSVLCLYLYGCGTQSTSNAADIRTATAATDEVTTSSDVIAEDKELKIPTATPEILQYSKHPAWSASADVEERVFLADVVVRADLLHAEAKVRTELSEEGVAPTYLPVNEFRIRVNEYLKGSGPSEIFVDSFITHTYLQSEDAMSRAEKTLARRTDTWDTHEAVLFLAQPTYIELSRHSYEEPDGLYHFVNPIPHRFGGYYLDDLTKAWLPVSETDSAGDTLLLLDPKQVATLSL